LLLKAFSQEIARASVKNDFFREGRCKQRFLIGATLAVRPIAPNQQMELNLSTR
jgi:hypothetical protein